MKQPVEKVWGVTTELFRNGKSSVHMLEIKQGGYCSEHRHAQKENIFYIIDGRLDIVMWKEGKRTINQLSAGSFMTVPIGVWHTFVAKTDVDCIEMYDYKYDGVDIERRTVGGLDKTQRN